MLNVNNLILANELRKTKKRVIYTKGDGEKIFCMETPDVEKEYKEGSKLKSMNGYVQERLERFDAHLLSIDAAFDIGYAITDIHLLRFVDLIAQYLYIGDVYYEAGIVFIYGKQFNNRIDVYDMLPSILEKNPLTLKSLALEATKAQYVDNYTGVILDDVCYIARNYHFFKTNTETTPIKGYIANGKLTWTDVDESAFIELATKEGANVRILKAEKNRVEVVYRSKKVYNFKGLKKYPYPIAILEDGEYAFYAKRAGS